MPTYGVAARRDGSPAIRVFAIVFGLAGLVAARAAGPLTAPGALVSGAGFGVGLLLLAGAAGMRPVPRRPTSGALQLIWGAFAGGALVAIALAGRSAGSLDGTPNTLAGVAYPVWAGITILVATAEEAVLRGALFAAVEHWGGRLVAVVVTATAFALVHVPLYGWGVVPLDLAVGLWLGGLRLATGSIVAPAVAHALADLATWWL